MMPVILTLKRKTRLVMRNKFTSHTLRVLCRALVFVAAILSTTVSVTAKDLTPGIIGEDDREISESLDFPLTSIGKINIAGYNTKSICTGTLIGPRQVLTAAHCLFNSRVGKEVSPGQIHFLAGLRRDEFAAHGI